MDAGMMNFSNSKKQLHGFTIIELLVVIIIIGVLASISIITYGSWHKSVTITQLKNDLNGAATAMENARTFGDAYPDDINNVATFMPTKDTNGNPVVTLTGGSNDGGTTYCIDAVSPDDVNLHYYTDSTIGTTGALQGTCSTAHPSPSGLVATPTSSSSISLSWTAVTGATGYTLQRDTTASFNTPTTVNQVGTSYVSSGLTQGSTYYYRVRSVTSGINSGWSSATSAIPQATVQALVVAGGGGGGGGNNAGGGGGAGGLIYNSSYVVAAGPVTVTVESGGTGGTMNADTATNGGNSVFGSLTAVGGGRGAYASPSNPAGFVGGSGGGGGAYISGSPLGGLGISGQGNSGGNGYVLGTYTYTTSGGGGGAGGVGGNGAAIAGVGGVGVQYSISGTATYYAGGGGGGSWNGYGTSNVGGLGGGGNGGQSSSATAGTANTGGGGGGAGYPATTAGNGGSGVVIISYPTGSLSASGGNSIYASGLNTVHVFTGGGTFTVN